MKSSVVIRLKLYKNSEMVYSTFRTTKRKMSSLVRSEQFPEWDLGTVHVMYNKKEDFWNSAEFTSLKELNEFLDSALEIDLIRAFA